MQLLIKDGARPGDSTAAARVLESGRPPTPAKTGAECRAVASLKEYSVVSGWTFRARTRMLFMRRSKWGPVPELVVKNRHPRVAPAPPAARARARPQQPHRRLRRRPIQRSTEFGAQTIKARPGT